MNKMTPTIIGNNKYEIFYLIIRDISIVIATITNRINGYDAI